MEWWSERGESLRDVARRNDLAGVVALLDGPDPPPIDSTDASMGWTALMEATMRGHVFVVGALLVRGAQVNLKDVHGQTALCFAVLAGHYMLVDLLLSRGADANLRTTSGMTALMHAARSNHRDIVEVLLARGADVSIAGPDRRTAEDLATATAIKELLRVSGRVLASLLRLCVVTKPPHGLPEQSPQGPSFPPHAQGLYHSEAQARAVVFGC
jgi:uncharacterized protein